MGALVGISIPSHHLGLAPTGAHPCDEIFLFATLRGESAPPGHVICLQAGMKTSPVPKHACQDASLKLKLTGVEKEGAGGMSGAGKVVVGDL